MRKRLRRIAFLFILIQGFTNIAQAQGCAEPGSVCTEFWAGFNSIFIGRVVETAPYRKYPKRASPRTRPDEMQPQMIVRFAVERSYRKYEEQSIEVEVLGNANQRSFVFQIGGRYLVFAQRKLFDRRMSVSPCSRTSLAANAQEDIDYLEGASRLNPVTDILNYHDDPVIQVSILQGKIISLPRPPYPEKAKAERAYGTVSVLILLDESGKVIRVKSLCGHPLLMEAAETAARQARFSPTLVSGRQVKVSTIITYNFVLS